MVVVGANIIPTAMFTDLDRHKSNASSHVLKSQVEALLCHRSDLPDLRIEAKHAVSKICLCEALIRSYGVHLKANNKHSSSPLNDSSRAREKSIYPHDFDAKTNLGVVNRPKPCPCRKWLVCLQIEEVEGFLTGAGHPWDRVAVSQSETQLHIYLRYRRDRSINTSSLDITVTTLKIFLLGMCNDWQ